MASLTDLSQAAGVTAVLIEMEMHVCVSRLPAEPVSGSFPQCAEKQGVTPKCVPLGECRGGQIIHSGRVHRADTGCLLSLASLKYRRRRKKKRHWSQARAAFEARWV